MQILGIIPARYASTRFPGKPLADIAGKSMIERVYLQAKKAARLHGIVIATDDERIFAHARSFGAEVVMTDTGHLSGTDRCFEALQKTGFSCDAVINIQGDEPFIEPGQIDLLAECLDSPGAQIATLVRKIDSSEILHDPNKVKAVLDNNQFALYFSRSAIPFQKIELSQWHKNHDYYLHVGLYAYKSDVLSEITRLPQGKLEKAESLEQLRWLENGYKIKVAETEHESFGVDTPQDLINLLKSFGK